MQRTLVIVKPDGVKRGLMGEIIKRLESRNLYMQECKYFIPDLEVARSHYQEHENKDFYDRITRNLISAKIMVMIWVGPNAVQIVRNLQGSTDPVQALPGTIRGDFCCQKEANVMHASDSVASAEREIKIWFYYSSSPSFLFFFM